MTDRELLELAAKAAGVEGHWSDEATMIRPFVFEKRCGVVTKSKVWNPLDDDGDALRLAVKLKLAVVCPGCVRDTEGRSQFVCDETDPDDHSATRRAIVRAAAEIGRAMP